MHRTVGTKYTPKNLLPESMASFAENGGRRCARELALFFRQYTQNPFCVVAMFTSFGMATGSLAIARNRSMGFELKRRVTEIQLIAPEACYSRGMLGN